MNDGVVYYVNFHLTFSGISFVRPVDGAFCRACKKFITNSIEEHCKSREHYDKFVDIVNGKKTKAFEIQSKKLEQSKIEDHTESGDKRKSVEDEDDDEDSGNWKRQKKNEYPICYDI